MKRILFIGPFNSCSFKFINSNSLFNIDKINYFSSHKFNSFLVYDYIFIDYSFSWKMRQEFLHYIQNFSSIITYACIFKIIKKIIVHTPLLINHLIYMPFKLSDIFKLLS